MTLTDALLRAQSLPPERQQEVADFVEFLCGRCRASETTPREFTPINLDQSFFGMWADRADMTDSTSYIQTQRQADWEQRHVARTSSHRRKPVSSDAPY